jgi:VWFA-related protein
LLGVTLGLTASALSEDGASYSFSGAVQKTNGEGVANITIVFDLTEGTGQAPEAVVTDAEGRFLQSGFSSGNKYTAEPREPGWVFGPPRIEFSEETLDVLFIGRPPFSVFGKVSDGSGKGVAGVTLAFSLVNGTGNVPAAVTTNAEGVFSQGGFTNGAGYQVSPHKDDLAFSPPSRDFSVETAAIPLTFTLIAPFELSGRVADASGEPVGGVEIVFAIVSGGVAVALPPVLTDEAGHWEQSGFSYGCGYVVTPCKPGHAFHPPWQLSSEPRSDLDFVATPPFSVSGRVTDERGQGVEGAEVAFSPNKMSDPEFWGCVAAYDFEGTCGDSVGENHGVGADVGYVEGKPGYGKAAYFYKEESVVKIGNGAAIANLARFTVGAWVLPFSDGAGNAGKIYDKASPNGGYIRFEVAYESAGTVRLFGRVMCGSSPADSMSKTTMTIGDWHHVAMTCDDAAKVVRLYIDGAEVSYNYQIEGKGTQKDDSAGQGCIGNAVGGTRRFDGYIDAFRLYERALGDEEIAQWHRTGCADSVPPLVVTGNDGSWSQSGFWGGCEYRVSVSKEGWGFTPGSLTFAQERSDLDFVGSPPYEVSGRVASPSGNGVEGVQIVFREMCGESPVLDGCVAAYDFEGSAEDTAADNEGKAVDVRYEAAGRNGSLAANFCQNGAIVNIGSDATLDNLATFTLSAWICPRSDGEGDGGKIFWKYSPAGGCVRFETAYERNGSVHLFGRVTCGSNNAESVSNLASPGVPLNTWHHVSMTWNNATKFVRLYIDGKETSYNYQQPGSSPQNDDSAGNACIGNYEGKGRRFDGYMDEYRIFNRTLTPAEIKLLATGGVSDPAPGGVQTDINGRWSQTGFSGGCRCIATPSKPGWGFTPEARDFGGPSNTVDFVATPPYTISGRVTDPSGRGVAGVVLRFSSGKPGVGIPLVVTTNENGEYVQTGFWGLCEYGVVPWKTGWGFEPAFRQFSETAGNVDFVGLPPYSASGKVMDTSGQPVSGVRISFSSVESRGQAPGAVTTGDDGTWFQTGFSGGAIYVASPSKGGWVFDPAQRQFVGEATGLDFVALPPYSARGRVTDPLGNGVPDVTVTFETDGGWLPAPVVTDPEGYWYQTGFAQGSTYRALPSKRAWVFDPSFREFSEEAVDQDFVGTPPYPVSGRVVDESGNGVEGVVVSFWVRSGNGSARSVVVTDAGGRWSQANFAAGVDFGVGFKKEDWAFTPSWTRFNAPLGEIVIVGAGPYAVSGRITDADGNPIAGVKIVFSPRRGTQKTPPAAVSGGDGTWSQSGFVRGNTYWAVPAANSTSFSPGYREFSGPATDLDFVESPRYAISGRALNSEGNPEPGVTIVFASVRRSAQVPAAVTTGSDGKFTQSGFAPGSPYRATAQKAGWTFVPQSFDFSAPMSDMVFVGKGPYAVSGKVINKSGQGVGDVQIVFVADDLSAYAPQPVVTAGDGTFHQSGFWSGRSYKAIPRKDRWTFLPGMLSFNDSANSLDFEAHEPQATLTVTSDYGTPSPSRGATTYAVGETVNAAVDVLVLDGADTRHTCIGWRGSSSVPAEGTDATLSFAIDEDSSLTWLWKTEYRLEVSASPEELGKVIVSGGEWFEKGSKPTVTAIPNDGFIFSGWSGDASGRAPAILVEMNQPRIVVAHFTVDSDGDGLPDDWEMQYFGGLSEDGFGDPDLDEAPNSVEYTFDTNPTQPNPKLSVVMSECGANAAIEFPQVGNKVSVLDGEANSVSGLAATDFVVWEDNVRQLPLDVSERGGDDAVSVALVLDNSGSMAGQPLGDSHQAANVFIDQLEAGDSAAIIKFGTTVSLVQRFTSDKEALHSAVNGVFDGFGDTAFYSAIHRALHESIMQGGTRAVVALTDGADNASSHSLPQVIEYANRVGIPVFVIGLGNVSEEALASLAEETGGQYYYAPDSSALGAIYDEISRIAANWYQADYVTSNFDPSAPPYPRSVTVWAHWNDAIGRDDGQYKPPRENTAPLCHVDTPEGEQRGDITVTFQLMDFESDVCSVELFYSRDGGWSWNRATVSADSALENLASSPQGETHSATWCTATDLPGKDEATIRLKVVPYDPKKGTPGETSDFAVRNNTRPSAAVDTPTGPQQGDVSISYRLADAEGDPCSISVEYSGDGGTTYQQATVAAGGDGMADLTASPEGIPHVFVWDSLSDIGYQSRSVRIRVTPSDTSLGEAGETEDFTVNNIPPARLSYSPQSLTFSAHEKGADPDAKVLEIWNSGEGILTWQIHSDSPWLIASPDSGQSSGEKDAVVVAVDVSGLTVGTYAGALRIESSDVASASVVVPVTLTVEEALAIVSVTPASLTFSVLLSQGDPLPQTLYVRNIGGGEMSYQAWVSASWLSVTPDTGSSTGEPNAVTVQTRTTGLSAGTYRATITIVAPRASNTPKLIPVSFTIADSPPEIAVQPQRLTFTGEEGTGEPPAQKIQVWNAGGMTLSWQAQTSNPWLSVSPVSGTSTGNKNDVSVCVKTAGLTPGIHIGSITVTANSATNSPVVIPVELTVISTAGDMTVSPSHLVFTTGRGEVDPAAQKLNVSSNGRLDWRAEWDAAWLSVSPREGSVVAGSCQVTVSVWKAGLDMGQYQGKITFTATNSPGVKQLVTVTLNIRPIEVPTDYPTIQEGVDAAYENDIVLVLPGAYEENLLVKKNVEIRSSQGMDFTTIDGTGLGAVVSFENAKSARLEGFTLVNGTGNSSERSSPAGGGIYCIESSPVIAECQIINNMAAWGGGICADRGSSPEIVDSIIIGNAADDGGGIFCYENASPKFTTCVIAENSAYWFGGGVCGIEESTLTLAGCLLYKNIADISGGGIYATQGCDLKLVSCTLADNASEEGGNILAEWGSFVTIVNSLIWGNPDDLILLGESLIEYSDVSEPEYAGGSGNIMAEPIFFDPAKGDYHLLPGSPCIDKASNEALILPEKDLDGDPRVLAVTGQPITDMGADEHDPQMVFIKVADEVTVSPDGNVSVPYTLWNSLSISCGILAEYSDDDGRTWNTATPSPSGEIPASAVSSPSGKQHTFVWNSAADVGVGFAREVRVRLKAVAPKASRPAVTEPFLVNAGL